MNNDFGDKKVLVVDNSIVMTRIVKNCLIKLGFKEENLFTAHEGNQAYLMTELVDFNLVTTNLHLKVKSGFELIQMVRSHSDDKIKNLPFLLITAENKEYCQEEMMSLGVNGFLHKPFQMGQIEKAINDIFCPPMDMDLAQSILNEIAEKESQLQQPKKSVEQGLGGTFNPKIISVFVDSTVEALGQYMVSTEPGDPTETDSLTGDFSSTISLSNEDHNIKLTLILYFPKEVACQIYEGLFGELDLEQVCGIVQELGNIIGGNVKPRLEEFSNDIYKIVYPDQESNFGKDALRFQLGFPDTIMDENHSVEIEDNTAPKFTIPFSINGQEMNLVTIFHKNSLRS